MVKYGRFIAVLGVMIVLIVGVVWIFSQNTPQTTEALLTSAQATSETASEATSEALVLPQMPVVTGNNLDEESLTFPQDFASDYALVVMPFDRDQQTNAIAWLPMFQRIQANDPRISYYSIAALEDLSPAIRLLVVQGLNFAVTDSATRQATVVLFLSNQVEFTQALGISNLDAMRVLLLNKSGQVLWQTVGDYAPEKEADLLEWLALNLPDMATP
jgi:hypothetical protein